MNSTKLRPPLPLQFLLAYSYLSHVLITRKGRRSLTLEPLSPSTQGESYNERLENSFDEDSDESDDDIDNDIRSSQIASMPHSRSTNFISGGSTDYPSNNTPAVYASEDGPSYLNDPETTCLPPDSLFTIQPTDSFFTGASDSFLWNDDAMLSPQTEQWKPETAGSSALTTTTNLYQEEVLMKPQMEQDLKQRRRSSGGTRLILEDVQPDTVGTIVKMLFDSGTDIRMRLESTQTRKE